MRVAICDNEEAVREYLKTLTKRYITAEVFLFVNGEDLLKSGQEFDIILLDICLEDAHPAGRLDGLQTAEQIRKTSDAIIIFVTAYREYVYDAYDVEAFHYLLKPVEKEKFAKVLQKAVAKRKEQRETEPLVIKSKGISYQIPMKDILYAENDARKIILHTRKGTYSYYEKMGVLEQKLGAEFFRCHRGYLVHLTEVAGYDRCSIQLKNGEMIFLAKQKYNDFVSAYMDFLQK